MRQLWINGILADLSDSQIIALTKQSNDIFDFQNKRSNLTNTLDLPKSKINNDIFGQAQDISSTGIERDFFEVLYIQNYEEIISIGQGKLVSSVGTYKFIIYWGNIDLSAILGDKTLRDLDLDDLTHVWNLANVTALNVGSNDLIYPVQNTHETEELNSGAVGDPLFAARVLPMVSLSRILEQIAIDNDIELVGSIGDDFINITDVPSDSYIPAITKEYLEADGIDSSVVAPISLSDITSTPFVFGDNQYGGGVITDEITVLKTGTYEYVTSVNASVVVTGTGVAPTTDIPVTISNIIVVDVYDEVAGAWGNPTYLQAIAGGYTYTEQIDTFGVVGGSATAGGIITGSPRFYVEEGTRIRIKVLYDISLDNNAESFLSFRTEFGVLPPSSIIFTPQLLIEFGDTWPIVKTLPEIKQIDLLKFVASKKAYLIDVEDGTRQVNFKPFKDIVNGVIDAQDISELTEADGVTITSYHCELSQENDLNYDNHETAGTTGDGQLIINDNTLNISSEFYIAPFSASRNEFWNSILIGRFPCIKTWNEELEDVGARIYRLKLETFTALYFTGSGTTQSTTQKYIAYWDEQDNYSNIIEAEYSEYREVMNDYIGCNALTNITAGQFKNYDLLEPFYIEQEGAYFLCRKIKDFVADKKTVFQIIKL